MSQVHINLRPETKTRLSINELQGVKYDIDHGSGRMRPGKKQKYQLVLFFRKLLNTASISRYVYEIKCRLLAALEINEESVTICNGEQQKELYFTVILSTKMQINVFFAPATSVKYLVKYIFLKNSYALPLVLYRTYQESRGKSVV